MASVPHFMLGYFLSLNRNAILYFYRCCGREWRVCSVLFGYMQHKEDALS